MNGFEADESRKIQSVLDLFKEYFSFQINGKNLETLIVQGGMGVDISTLDLATAVSKTGSAGTVATTLTSHEKELSRYQPNDNILGINNLVAALDYEGNIHYKSKYELGKTNNLDYIFSGAGISREVASRVSGQADFLEQEHYWTIPIVSLVSQAEKYFQEHKKTGEHRKVGMVCLENGDAGGHNHPHALGFEETLALFKEANIDKKGEKIIYAGGVRTPQDFVRVLDAGFDAVQLGSLFLLAEETNIFDDYRKLVLNAKEGDVGNIVSPAGLPAKGFVNEGVMKYAMRGVDSKKLSCEDDALRGCFANCKKVVLSAKAAGVTDPGDYCIKRALRQLHTKKDIYEAGPVYFSGTRPEDLFIQDFMHQQQLVSLPAKTLIGKMLAGVFDSIMDGDGLTDEHRLYLEHAYTHNENEETYAGKIFSA